MQPIVRRRFNSRHAAAVLLGGLSLLSACDKQTAKAAGNTAPPAATSDASQSAPASATPAPATAPSNPSTQTATAVTDSNSAPSETDNKSVAIGSVSIASDETANGGGVTDVDFVVAYEPAAAQEIAKLSAASWFEKRSSYGAGRAQVISWHVQAGTNIPETPVDLTGKPQAAFVFVHYKSPGDHRKQIDGEGALAITLGPHDFTAEVGQD